MNEEREESVFIISMMEEPLVSILVPVYGVERYIERCARSLFEQTYENLEFVFVNDCTPDKSMEVLAKVMEDYPERKGQVTILSHDTNRGLAAVRNTLLDHCHGEFLIHVDSDDWVESHIVELLMKKQQENDADIVSGLMLFHFTDRVEKEANSGTGLDKDTYLQEFLRSHLRWFAANRLFRTTLYREHAIRWEEGINLNEDFLVMPRLLYYARQIGVVEEYTYHYERRNENSYMEKFARSWDLQQQVIKSHQFIDTFFQDKEPVLRETTHRLTIKQYRDMLWMTLENNNRKGYDYTMRHIQTMPHEYWSEIGWDNGLKRWLESHYHLARLTLPLRRWHGRRVRSDE